VRACCTWRAKLAPDMIDRAREQAMVTGKHVCDAARPMSPALRDKAAQRILPSRSHVKWGPLALHVSYVSNRAVIDTPGMRAR